MPSLRELHAPVACPTHNQVFLAGTRFGATWLEHMTPPLLLLTLPDGLSLIRPVQAKHEITATITQMIKNSVEVKPNGPRETLLSMGCVKAATITMAIETIMSLPLTRANMLVQRAVERAITAALEAQNVDQVSALPHLYSRRHRRAKDLGV